MYDNRFTVPNPNNVWNFNKHVDSFSWSAASNVVLDDRSSFYLRYASGEKAPDYAFFRTYNSQFRLDNLKGRPQTVEQWELGYTFSPRFSVNLNINNLLDGEGVMTWRGWGVNPGDQPSFTSLPATGKDTMLQYVPIQPRACYLSTTYKF